MSQIFSNYASSYLASSVSDTDTSLLLAPLSGGVFRAPAANEFELLVLTDGTNWEVVKCTGRVNDTLTVVRGFEGTARAWENGTFVKSVVTRATMENMLQKQDIGASIALFNYQNFR
jgi:hypothetical protein